MSQVTRVDLSKPKYDQSTFCGRLKHFFSLTNPLNLLVSSTQLNNAKLLVDKHSKSEEQTASDEDLWRAKYLVDSAFHPDTGEKMLFIGRMSAQVPMNMLVTGCMLSFYKKSSHIIFWQWFNQSFNAIVNYTNRSGPNPISTNTLVTSYLSATGSALAVAIGLNRILNRMKLPQVLLRFVPFLAVFASNCVNIPLMRRSELSAGIPVYDEKNNFIDDSKIAAKNSIMMVILSRNLMPLPSMLTIPFLMESLEKKPFLQKYPSMIAPLQIIFFGIFLVVMTPVGCSLFPQKSSLPRHKLEQHVQEKAGPDVKNVSFNKGL